MTSPLTLRPLWLLSPLLFISAFLLLDPGPRQAKAVPSPTPAQGDRVGRTDDRLIVIVLDSLRRKTLEAPGIMPNLLALSKAPGVTTLDDHTCASNFSLPCLQTIFEGRESPMASGLTEFTGKAQAQQNLLRTASEAGYGVALVSDELLHGLYGRFTRVSDSKDAARHDPLASDLAAVRRTGEFLQDPANRLVVLHTVGTDHITHYDLPGSPRYIRHFHEVDAAVRHLLDSLDLSRDSVVILGDHGHNEEGHHVRESLAIFVGRRFEHLFARISVPGSRVEERDLLFFLSYPLMLPLPAQFEGTYFAARSASAADEDLARFVRLQRATLMASGLGEAETERRMKPDWRPDTTKEWARLWRALPLLLCLLGWVLGCYDDPLVSARTSSLVGGAIGAGVWMGLLAGIPPLALAVAPCAWIGWHAWMRRHWRVPLLLVALLAAAVATSAIEPAWARFFHSRDEFHPGVLVFFAMMLTAGGLTASLRSGLVADWPFGTQLACLLALPAGVYYYQFNENLLRSYLIPAALVAGWTLARRRGFGVPVAVSKWQAALAIAMLVVCAMLLLPQEAGGWQWHAWLVRHLEAMPTAVSIGALVLLGGCTASLVPGRASRGTLAALVAASAAFSCLVGGLRLQSQVAAMVAVAFAAAWLALRKDDEVSGGEQEGLMALAVSLVVVLSMIDGFVINNVDFTFALKWIRGAHSDGAIFLAVAPSIAVKYAWPILALLAFVRLAKGARVTERVVAWLSLFLVAKLLALLFQVLVGALDPGEKFFELAMTDFLFVCCTAIVLTMWTLLVWAIDAAAARTTGVRA